jgi:hypothetical protein
MEALESMNRRRYPVVVVLAALALPLVACRQRARRNDPSPQQPIQYGGPVQQQMPMQMPMPTQGGVSGTWNSVFGGGTGAGGAPITLTLAQSNTDVTGAYQQVPGSVTTPPGTLSGTLTGSELQGTWRDATGSSGTVRLTFAADLRSFTGTWASSSLSGPWTGTRAM